MSLQKLFHIGIWGLIAQKSQQLVVCNYWIEKRNTEVSSLLMHWAYHSIALSCRCICVRYISQKASCQDCQDVFVTIWSKLFARARRTMSQQNQYKKCWQVSITGLSQKWFGCKPGKCNIDTYSDRYKVLYHGGLVRSESGDIMTGILDICRPDYVIIMVADVMSWCQISTGPSAPTMLTLLWLHCHMSHIAWSYESYSHGTVIMLRPLHNVW